jgi:hypothetical protein
MSNGAIPGWNPDVTANPSKEANPYTGSWSLTQPNSNVVFLATIAVIIPLVWPLTLYVWLKYLGNRRKAAEPGT